MKTFNFGHVTSCIGGFSVSKIIMEVDDGLKLIGLLIFYTTEP